MFMVSLSQKPINLEFFRKLSCALICSLALVSVKSHANATQEQIADVKSLLNWAVYLSEYDTPVDFPEIKFVEHEYLVLHACLGKPCKVIGWYNDRDIVYFDKSIAKLDSMLERSVVVHELIHYLQHKSGKFTTDCSDSVMREREAYEMQRQFFYAYGALSPIRMHQHHCAPNINADIESENKSIIQSDNVPLNAPAEQQISSNELIP